ncbi:hypothetical protein H5410_019800 [Solanum commersonii]|uniref:Uncharacterized protein n=1 Tax=Solanum commersonii TaxID=4109 RepID=A0A9J5Z9D3_SOLCO|nr:hypothetical protein H5410_019800 [Solanum commersonii]
MQIVDTNNITLLQISGLEDVKHTYANIMDSSATHTLQCVNYFHTSVLTLHINFHVVVPTYY